MRGDLREHVAGAVDDTALTLASRCPHGGRPASSETSPRHGRAILGPVLPLDEDLRARWGATLAFVAIGVGCIIVGGLVAAVTGPTGFKDGSWAAAYLVLVAGVAQLGLGAGQALLAAEPPTRRLVIGELAAWNSGNVAVLAGTFLGSPLLVDAGGLALVVALGLFLHGVRGSRVKGRWPLVLYRLLAGVVAVSIPVGLALSALRHG